MKERYGYNTIWFDTIHLWTPLMQTCIIKEDKNAQRSKKNALKSHRDIYEACNIGTIIVLVDNMMGWQMNGVRDNKFLIWNCADTCHQSNDGWYRAWIFSLYLFSKLLPSAYLTVMFNYMQSYIRNIPYGVPH